MGHFNVQMPTHATVSIPRPYRGRLAPTPSGWLHMGHAATFQIARDRAREADGTLVYRTEDIDPARCRKEFAEGAMEDLRWWGLDWDEGPDLGGPYGPYTQSQRLPLYRDAFAELRERGLIYPSPHSRKEIAECRPALSPVDGDPLFPVQLRPGRAACSRLAGSDQVNWRFRVPDGRAIRFTDGRTGEKCFVAGRDFGDFIIWKKDGWPAYELAVAVDDHAMKITEVVRGEDLLMSTARQILLYEALRLRTPRWYHCSLVVDPETGIRLSKTHKSLALRALRDAGHPAGQYPAHQAADSA